MISFETNKIPILESENYVLRGLKLDDAPQLFEFMSNVETMKYITPHPIQTLEEMEEKIKDHLANFQKAKEIPWVILEKKTNHVIGFFRFHKLHLWHRKAEMGTVLHRDYQRKGVSTEVLGIILEFGFNKLRLNRIVGDIFAENEGSKRLLEKFGFHQDGILRQTDFDGTRFHDTVVYSMLKEEYDERTKNGK